MGLVLQAVDVTSPYRWRWLLSDEKTGRPLADHLVSLDPLAEEVEAFRDLYQYARWRAVPDRRASDQVKIVAAAGAWAGRELLGEVVGATIAAEAPVTVRVSVPAPAEQVLMWPLELAHANGRPLAARGDVTFVYDIAAGGVRRKDPVGGTLRVLAVFSQPTRTSVLALRRERFELARLFRRIAARERAAVELRIVQYGVTRDRLAEIADSGNGWDVLHLAGHGGRGVFVLEHADGSPDRLDTANLIEMLRPTKHRLKLAVVSACESAAETVAETLRLVGLAEQAEGVGQADALTADPNYGLADGPEVIGVARALVQELDCAVVAMRYPVTDEFAIALGAAFYEHVLGRRHTVDVAAARAAAEAAGGRGGMVRRSLSLATPGVFGTRSAALALDVPRGQPQFAPGAQKMSFFPDEPERFVGRARAMTIASAVLAPESPKTAVLLYGMTGSGKTSCAVELAHRHQDAFAALAFWKAPAEADAWGGALADLARALEVQLGDYQFSMAAHIGTEAALSAYLPRLRHVMRNNGLLLVLDNLETLLTPDGIWRDPRWEMLTGMLTGHGGESRLIMATQIAPAGFSATRSDTEVLAVHALSLDESAALARELPHLRSLLHADDEQDDDDGPMRSIRVPAIAADRERLRRVLRVVQGHPKLMELADAAASDRSRLDHQLAAAEQAAGEAVGGRGLETFFRDGETSLEPGQFLSALGEWTRSALSVLSPDTRLMAESIVFLEDADRRSDVITAIWGNLWQRLAGPGNPPEPRPLLDALTFAALVEVQEEAVPATEPALLRVHPGVAAAVAAAAGAGVRESVDAELAAFWGAASEKARVREGGEWSTTVVRSSLAAAPYLLRRGDWDAARLVLERSIGRDRSPELVQTVLPGLRQIASATGTPRDAGVLGRALMSVDAMGAERLLREAMATAAEADDYRTASNAAGDLINLLRAGGRLGEALGVAEQKEEYSRRAGLGSWTQLADHARMLRILVMKGEHERVLSEVEGLCRVMDGLSTRRDASETVNTWNVRESILSIGRAAAMESEDWERCLQFNAATLESVRWRSAPAHEVASNRFNDADPLIRLGRLAEARLLLADCQQVFEEYADTVMLAMVLSTRATLEDALGHRQAAVELQCAALRLRYAASTRDPQRIAISHHNLAFLLRRLGSDRAGQRAHRLAGALIYAATDMSHHLSGTVLDFVDELHDDGDDPSLPSTIAEVIAVADQTEGVQLGAMLAILQPDPTELESVLAEIFAAAERQL